MPALLLPLAAAEPSREQPPVPAASGPLSLSPASSGGFSLPAACGFSCGSAGTGGQQGTGAGIWLELGRGSLGL